MTWAIHVLCSQTAMVYCTNIQECESCVIEPLQWDVYYIFRFITYSVHFVWKQMYPENIVRIPVCLVVSYFWSRDFILILRFLDMFRQFNGQKECIKIIVVPYLILDFNNCVHMVERFCIRLLALWFTSPVWKRPLCSKHIYIPVTPNDFYILQVFTKISYFDCLENPWFV